MRKLGQQLGVEAMTLYAYMSSKDDLLDAVADQVGEGLVLPTANPADWQKRIRNAVEAWSRMQADHPGAFPLLYRRRAGTARERAVTEEIMDALATAGFEPTRIALLYQTLVSYLDGALLHWPRSEWRADLGWQLVAAHVDATSYPRVAAVAPLAAQLSWDDVFQAGLELFLSGLESTLRNEGRPSGRGDGPGAAAGDSDSEA